MKPIAPGQIADADRLRMDSRDLEEIARLVSGRVHIQCPACRNWVKPSVLGRTLRMGSSPDLGAVDVKQPGFPRLYFVCGCGKKPGFIQGDEWASGDEADDLDAPTRWEHLEINETGD